MKAKTLNKIECQVGGGNQGREEGGQKSVPYNLKGPLTEENILSQRSQVDFSLGDGLPDRFQWVTWSTVGHSLVAAVDNDLYYVGDVSKASTTSHRLTTTGRYKTIYNGIADRLYEGEVSFGSIRVFSK